MEFVIVSIWIFGVLAITQVDGEGASTTAPTAIVEKVPDQVEPNQCLPEQSFGARFSEAMAEGFFQGVGRGIAAGLLRGR